MAETKSDKKYRGQEVWTGPFRVLLRLAIVIGILIFPVMIYWPNYQDWRMRSEYTQTALESLMQTEPGKVKFTSTRSRYADTRIVVLVDGKNNFIVDEVADVDTPMEEGDVSALAEGAEAEYFGYWNGTYLTAHDIRGSITYFRTYNREYIPPPIPEPTDSLDIEPHLAELDTLDVASLWESRARRRLAGRTILSLDPSYLRYRDDGSIVREGREYQNTLGYVVLLKSPEPGPEMDDRHYSPILNTIMRERIKGAYAVVDYIPEGDKEERLLGRLGVAQVEWLHLPNRTLRLR
jgi:hypothetical protein